MPFAAVTVPVAGPRSICPREATDVQATIRTLWPHAGGGDALSEGGASLGRAHWIGPCPGQKLAADGIWMPVAVGRARRRPRLAIGPGHDHTVGGGSRSARSGPGGRAGKSFLSTDRSADRVSSRPLH